MVKIICITKSMLIKLINNTQKIIGKIHKIIRIKLINKYFITEIVPSIKIFLIINNYREIMVIMVE